MTSDTKNQGYRTALVTGGSRGIGAAIVSDLASRGIKVIAPTREELDLSDPISIQRYSERINGEDLQVDILINNAGINFPEPLEQISQATWLTTMEINLNAPFRLAQAVAPHMKRNSWGRIVNISSIFGVVTRQHRTAYSVAKSALAGLTRSLAVELGRDHVLVNSVAPGYVETDLTRQNNSAEELARIAGTIPLGRLAQPSEIAKFVSFLCSDENSYITGQVLVADGGFTCL